MPVIIIDQSGDVAAEYRSLKAANKQALELLKKLDVKPRRSRSKRSSKNPQAAPLELEQLQTGMMILVEGEPGVYKFKSFAKNGDMHMFGGEKGHEATRSFSPTKSVYAAHV